MLKRNKAQEEAINTTQGPVIVISCPGSGKTTTLIRRIKNIIDNGGDPRRILMITFSNSAAKDMESRYSKMYGSNPGVSFMTIHSFCFTILKHEFGYTRDSLLGESQRLEFFVNQLKRKSFASDPWEMAKTISAEISLVRNSYTPLKHYTPKGCDKELFSFIYDAYEAEKRHAGKIDFDDMLVKCEELLATNRRIREKWASLFDYIQVDEYQDTNQIQKDIIYSLIERTNNLCVVGDDDQAIYGWRSADPSIMMNFQNDFQNAKVIYMSTNYRSAKQIVTYSDILIKRNKKRFTKEFISNRGDEDVEGVVEFHSHSSKENEIASIVDKIQYLHEVDNIDYSDMAVLFRTNKQANLPAEWLYRSNIPFSSTEKINSIYDSYIFKDIRSYVELSIGNRISANLYNVLNHPNRYLNIQQFNKLPFSEEAFLEAISPLRFSKDSWRHPAVEKSIKAWFLNFGPGKISETTLPIEVMDKMADVNSINYLKHLKSIASMKNIDIQEEKIVFDLLMEDAKKFKTVSSWFKYADMSIVKTQEINRKKDVNGVQLMTMHKSKGLEWKVVFVIGVDAEILPGKRTESDADVEEERRVLYVAMTRAEDMLFISSSGHTSHFISELLSDYKESCNPTVRKKFPGTRVKHVTYGEGKVVRYVDNAIVINFDSVGLKKILFPEGFQKNICKYL